MYWNGSSCDRNNAVQMIVPCFVVFSVWYVVTAVALCLVAGGLLLFFLFPRTVSLASSNPSLRPTNIYVNVSAEILFLTITVRSHSATVLTIMLYNSCHVAKLCEWELVVLCLSHMMVSVAFGFWVQVFSIQKFIVSHSVWNRELKNWIENWDIQNLQFWVGSDI